MAILLTGVAILGVLGMLDQARAVTGQIQRRATENRRTHAVGALLRSLALQLSLSNDTLPTFVGTDNTARFRSRCRVPRGWVEQCSVVVSIADSSGLSELRLAAPGIEQMTVLRDSTPLLLRYLESAKDGGHWRRSWISTSSVPLGFGVVRSGGQMPDTAFFRIGRRE